MLAASGHVVGLNDVSLSIPAASIYTVTGLSGSGNLRSRAASTD
ncbi:hypothetical protein [Paenirhodobacter populi]|nr:hypothetical protein [Sinirhodobacter populi]